MLAMQADYVGPPLGHVLDGGTLARGPVGGVCDRRLYPREDRAEPTRQDDLAWGRRIGAMAMTRFQDGTADVVGIRVEEFELGKFLGVRVQQPGMIDDREQDQR